jgi:hypothetical protein
MKTIFSIKKKQSCGISGFLVLCTFTLIVSITTGQTVITSGTKVTVLSGTYVTSVNNFTLQSGATLNNSGTLVLKQNLANQNVSPNSLGSGACVFSGAPVTGQTISGENIIKDLTLNDAYGLSLAGNTRVNGVLALTNGLITLNNSNLLLGPSAAISGTPSSTNMVEATGNGQFQKEFPTGFTGNFFFPVGGTEYSPVILIFTTGTFGTDNYVGVNLKNFKYNDPGVTGSYLKRYWNLAQANITDFSCAATFQYVPADVEGTESDVYCFRVLPTPWITYNPANTGTHQLNVSGLGSFGTFTGAQGTNGATPPENRSEQDLSADNGQTLCFDATETIVIAGNGTAYTVQNGGTVHLVAGQKISMLPGTKVFAGGVLHGYISTDGHYCDLIKNELVEANTIETPPPSENPSDYHKCKVYPNPTSGNFTLELSSDYDNTSVNVQISGIWGEKILSMEMNGERKHDFSLSGRNVGVYFIRVVAGSKAETKKIIKQE